MRLALLPVGIAGMVGVIVLAIEDWADFLPDAWVMTVGPVIGLLVGGGWLVKEMVSVNAARRGPMLLVRGVLDAVEAPETGDAESTAAIAAGLEHWLLVVAQPQVHVLTRHGRLTETPIADQRYLSTEALAEGHAGRPRLLLRCTVGVGRHLSQGDQVAVLCLGDGRAVTRLRDQVGLTRAGFRRRTAHKTGGGADAHPPALPT